MKNYFNGCLLVLLFSTFAYSAETANPTADILVGRQVKTRNHFELGIFLLDTSFRNAFVNHPYAAHLAIGYHVLECFEVELAGGYVFLHDETGLVKRVRAVSVPAQPLLLPELWQTKWQLGLNAQWIPLYGKLSLFSEMQTHFQIYVLAGGALEGAMRILDWATPIQDNLRFSFSLGAGTRLFLTDRIALRSEIKHSFGFNPRLPSGEMDISNTAWLSFGISFLL